jgi:hypothetical protein
MSSYRIRELLRHFDEFDAKRGGRLTGRLSATFGEDLLLDVLAHALASDGGVELLQGVPWRDDVAFHAAQAPKPSVRDLDAWFSQAGELIAVECKQWTASSVDMRRSVPEAESLKEYAWEQWKILTAADYWERWDGTTKIALPLQPPAGWTSEKANRARRILIVWRPISSDGISPLSHHSTTTLRGSEWVELAVEVFSASLYLRGLLAAGIENLPAAFPRLDLFLNAIDSIIERQPDP